jgi:Putative peptidoglycan-binding domain-containing protein
MNIRPLKPDEISLAQKVFQNELPYDKVYIADKFLPGNTVPVTVAMPVAVAGKFNPIVKVHTGIVFVIYWGDVIYHGSAASIEPATLIHELTHVWQGSHDKNKLAYMAESLIAQGKAIWDSGDRNKAYVYDKTNYRNWKEYNVEQQANIVGDWFDPNDGNQSITDLRYPYISDNIRKGNPSANYAPPTPLLHGAHAEIKEAQEVLFNLGYLTDKKYIDGFMGPKTKKALWSFQERNGLIPPDGILGPNTRNKLKELPHTLRRAP